MGEDNYRESPRFETKQLPTFIKAVDEDRGIVEHFVAVMGNEDDGADIIEPGAFAKTIQERMGRIRVLDNHGWDSATRVVGRPLGLREVGRAELTPEVLRHAPSATGALLATTEYALKTSRGHDIFQLVKGGFLPESSIGYDPIQVAYEEVDDGKGNTHTVRHLKEIRLWEYSNVIFGMNPATATVSAKSASPAVPAEGKPAPDVTENTIRIRVRDPGDFEEDSFRTIRIGAEDGGIQAVIGRLKGETVTTVQSYIFDKDKWTVATAQEWVDEHASGKQMTTDPALVPVETVYLCKCPECGYETESETGCEGKKCPECGAALEWEGGVEPPKGKGDSMAEGHEDKGASGKANWPLADRARGWDNAAAERRIRSWAGAEDGPNAKYRSCHFWFNGEDAGNFTAYKLLFCDVVDGEARAIPRGIFAVAGVLSGARGGADIPAADQAAIRRKVSAYYARMRQEFDDDSIVPPWEKAAALIEEEVKAAAEVAGKPVAELSDAEMANAVCNAALRLVPEAVPVEGKIGRAISAANARRIGSAIATLIQLLEDAGIDVPGVGREPEEEEEEEAAGKSRELADGTAEAAQPAVGTESKAADDGSEASAEPPAVEPSPETEEEAGPEEGGEADEAAAAATPPEEEAGPEGDAEPEGDGDADEEEPPTSDEPSEDEDRDKELDLIEAELALL